MLLMPSCRTDGLYHRGDREVRRPGETLFGSSSRPAIHVLFHFSSRTQYCLNVLVSGLTEQHRALSTI